MHSCRWRACKNIKGQSWRLIKNLLGQPDPAISGSRPAELAIFFATSNFDLEYFCSLLTSKNVKYLIWKIHICLEPEAQGSDMTINRIYVESKFPYFISYRGKWVCLFCCSCRCHLLESNQFFQKKSFYMKFHNCQHLDKILADKLIKNVLQIGYKFYSYVWHILTWCKRLVLLFTRHGFVSLKELVFKLTATLFPQRLIWISYTSWKRCFWLFLKNSYTVLAPIKKTLE